MAFQQATPPRPVSAAGSSGTCRRTGVCQPQRRASSGPVIPNQGSPAALPKLPPIRTKIPYTPRTASPASPTLEHSPCSFFSPSPSSRASFSSYFSPIHRGTPHFSRRSETGTAAQSRLGERTVFRPPGVAGKGSHRRAEQPPRPQPQPPRFQEFHFSTEGRPFKERLAIRQQKKAAADAAAQPKKWRATPVPETTYRGPPVVLDRSSPLRRAA